MVANRLHCGFLADLEGLADEFSNTVIALGARAEDQGTNLFDIRPAITIQHTLIYLGIYNLADKLGMQADFVVVNHPAFQDHRELPHVGRINKFGSDGRKPGFLEFINAAARYQAKKISGLDMLL